MQRRKVVTAFLRRDEKLLLLRRSADVGSYQGRWSAVSGYLEDATPLAQAYREIHEETGFEAAALNLQSVATPFELAAPELDRLWVIHPFLFDLQTKATPSLDWENLEHRWVSPAEMAELDTVPALARAYGDCLNAPAAQLAFTEDLEQIVRDRDHGAAQLARMGLMALKTLAQTGGAADISSARDRLSRFAEQLIRARPSMAPLSNLTRRWLEGLQAEADETAAGLHRRLAGLAAKLSRASETATEQAAAHLTALLQPGQRVITLSYSSTVRAALIAALDKDITVVVAESRPLYEGAALARDLAAAGLAVTVITDAQLAVQAAEADLAVIGADCVTADAAVINKAGSHLLALAAAEACIPLYAVYEGMKRQPPGSPVPPLEEMPAAELGLDLPKEITVLNCYFELVPARLVSAHVTEEGVDITEV